jgi:hypothetical protein
VSTTNMTDIVTRGEIAELKQRLEAMNRQLDEREGRRESGSRGSGMTTASAKDSGLHLLPGAAKTPIKNEWVPMAEIEALLNECQKEVSFLRGSLVRCERMLDRLYQITGKPL